MDLRRDVDELEELRAALQDAQQVFAVREERLAHARRVLVVDLYDSLLLEYLEELVICARGPGRGKRHTLGARVGTRSPEGMGGWRT